MSQDDLFDFRGTIIYNKDIISEQVCITLVTKENTGNYIIKSIVINFAGISRKPDGSTIMIVVPPRFCQIMKYTITDYSVLPIYFNPMFFCAGKIYSFNSNVIDRNL